MSKVSNTYEVVSNYCTDALQETLDYYGNRRYSLVSTMMAKNKYKVDCMYLFFTKVEN